MSFPLLKIFSGMAVLMLVCACSTPLLQDAWPADLPDQELFRDAWRGDAANQPLQSETEYLLWVQRFYQGFNMVPGWLAMSVQVRQRLVDAGLAPVDTQLEALGSRIAAEWAKDNSVRLVNTRMVAVWRDALLEALSQNDLANYLQKLEQDLGAILTRQLAGDAIVFERYYIDEFDF